MQIICLTGVRSEKITLGDPKLGSRSSDVLNLVHPKVASEDERVWSFPHDNDTNDTDVRQRYRSPIGKKVSPLMQRKMAKLLKTKFENFCNSSLNKFLFLPRLTKWRTMQVTIESHF